MGHLSHHKAYLDLRARLDRMPTGFSDTPEARELLSLLFRPEEAELAARLPFRPQSATRIAARVKRPEAEVRTLLEQMAERGLVFDFLHARSGKMLYCAAPPVVGFFEFSLMRRRSDLDQPALAEAFEAFFDRGPGLRPGLSAGKTQIGRTLVQEGALEPDQIAEAMPYERASEVVGSATGHAVSLCYCRHLAEHNGRACAAPAESCLSLSFAAEYVLRHGHGRAISRTEALEILDRSRQANLVYLADNVQRQVSWLCSCCGCCCEQLRAINRHGLPGAVMTSSWLAQIERERCRGCGRCARRCPVQAISLLPGPPSPRSRGPALQARVDEQICLGCGVCRSACRHGSLTMKQRAQRVLTPESTLERVLTMALERDRLQDLLFDDLEGPSQLLMLRLTGAVLRLPALRKLLLAERLSSRFVAFLASKAKSRAPAPPS